MPGKPPPMMHEDSEEDAMEAMLSADADPAGKPEERPPVDQVVGEVKGMASKIVELLNQL